MFRKRRELHDDTPIAIALVAPGLVGLLAFIALPFALATGFSFTDMHLGSPLPVEFVGLKQYGRILTDPSFLRALVNNFLFALGVVPTQTALALGLALALNRPLRGMPVFRTLFFMPVVFPMALISVVWQLLYAPGPDGALNAFLHAATLGLWQPQDFLHNQYLALPAVMLLSVWQGVGFQMVIMLAGLQSIPESLYQAAAIDGAGKFSQFLHVTLPQMRNTIIFVVLVTCIFAFRLYDQIRIMTQGQPNEATTTVMYQAVTTVFELQQIARASAMTVAFFAIVLVLTWLQRVVAKQERTIE
jgi:multiple sugar transport system permease protein